RDLITLSGLRPGEDIEIKFAGVRPGEKLFEQLATDAEHADKTKHPKIFIGRIAPPPFAEVVRGVDELIALADQAAPAHLRAALRGRIPESPGGVGAAADPPGSKFAVSERAERTERAERAERAERQERPDRSGLARLPDVSAAAESHEPAKPRRGEGSGPH